MILQKESLITTLKSINWTKQSSWMPLFGSWGEVILCGTDISMLTTPSPRPIDKPVDQ